MEFCFRIFSLVSERTFCINVNSGLLVYSVFITRSAAKFFTV